MANNVSAVATAKTFATGPRCRLDARPKGRDVLEAPVRLMDVWLSIGEHCRYQDLAALCATNKGFNRLKLMPPFQRLLSGKLPQLVGEAAAALAYVRMESCKPISQRWLEVNKPVEDGLFVTAYQAAMVGFWLLNGTYDKCAVAQVMLMSSVAVAIGFCIIFCLNQAAALGDKLGYAHRIRKSGYADSLLLQLNILNAICLTEGAYKKKEHQSLVNSPITGIFIAFIEGAISHKKLYEHRWATAPQASLDTDSNRPSRELTPLEVHQYQRLLLAFAALQDVLDPTGSIVDSHRLTSKKRAILIYCANLVETNSLPA